MANKRDLKRSLNYACSELFAEGVSTYLNTKEDDHAEIDAVLASILRTHSDFVRRISHPEPGMSAKKYYKVLVDDFNKQIGEFIDQLEAL